MSTPTQASTSAPRRVLSTFDGIVLVVGLIVGAGIFRSPPIVAGNVADVWSFFAVWVAGGLVALAGALCYAELASAYPHPGGEYHVLRYTFGQSTGFMLGWARMTVMQTGSIALLAFVFADYAVRLLPGDRAGDTSALGAVLAAAAVVVLTIVNIAGLRPGRRAQYVLTAAEVGGLCAVIVAGFVIAVRGSGADVPPPATTAAARSSNLPLALVFVLLTYGGWSEAAYLSAELQDRQRGVRRTLTWAVAIVTSLYLLANVALRVRVRSRGRRGVAGRRGGCHARGGRPVGRRGGERHRHGRGALVGERIDDHRRARQLRRRQDGLTTRHPRRLARYRGRRQRRAAPRARRAGDHLAHPRRVRRRDAGGVRDDGGVHGAGLLAHAPARWASRSFVLRRREPERERPFRVPLYPLTPLLFCVASAGMLYSSVAYAGRGALLGVAVMLAGLPLLLIGRSRVAPADQSLGSVESTP